MSTDPIRISTPLTDTVIKNLRVGDRVRISGALYTARDAAHQRLVEAINRGESLPFSLQGQVIYYVGPSPARPGQVIGSAGPTTASRVDPYTPALLEHGLKGMIGKGKRDEAVRQALVDHIAVYFVTVGGAAALIAEHIKQVKVIAYEDLSAEAIRELKVEDFPAVVANDAYGADLYVEGRQAYEKGRL